MNLPDFSDQNAPTLDLETILGGLHTFDLQTDAIDLLVQSAREEQEAFIRSELAANDWDKYPIVDFVWICPSPTPQLSREPEMFTPSFEQRVKVKKHGRKAPPLEESAIPGKRCDIQRVTRPLYEKIRSEYL